MMDKVLSIIIPAYNAEKYLKRCVDSLVKSKYLYRIEIMIVDDGSTDKTVEISEEYIKRYPDSIRLIKKENANVGSVYNIGFKECKGKYCKEIDADDWVNVAGLDRLLESIEEINCDLVLNSFETVDEEGVSRKLTKPFKNGFEKYGKELSMSEYGSKIAPAMHSFTYKTKVLRNLPRLFDENCYHVDLEYTTFPMINCKTFIAYEYPIYKYLLGRSDQSMSIKNLIKNIDQHIKVFFSCVKYYETFLSEQLEVGTQVFERLCGVLWNLFRICFSMEDRKQSIAYILHIINCLKSQHPVFFNMLRKRKQDKLIFITIKLDESNYFYYDVIKTMLRIAHKI